MHCFFLAKEHQIAKWNVSDDVPYITYFRDLKNLVKSKFPRIKGAAKIKDAKFSDLYKNLYFSFPSARSIHTSRRVQISVQRLSLFLLI